MKWFLVMGLESSFFLFGNSKPCFQTQVKQEHWLVVAIVKVIVSLSRDMSTLTLTTVATKGGSEKRSGGGR